MSRQITFDWFKYDRNLRKHGVRFDLVSDFEWDDALIGPDTRRDYGEDRMVAIGYIGLRLYVVIYVEREESRRIISLRKANSREEKRYAQA